MFVDYQNVARLLKNNVMGTGFVALQIKTIHVHGDVNLLIRVTHKCMNIDPQ